MSDNRSIEMTTFDQDQTDRWNDQQEARERRGIAHAGLVGSRAQAWTGDRSGPSAQFDQHGEIVRVYDTTGQVEVHWDRGGSSTYRLKDLIKEMPRDCDRRVASRYMSQGQSMQRDGVAR